MKAFRFPRSYFKIYNFIAIERIKANDLRPLTIHTILTITLTTSLLMWAHTALALVAFPILVPGIVGILCSIVHMLSPLLFRYTNKAGLVTNLILTSGMIHQTTFSYYSGGFTSRTLIWYGIIPFLAGLAKGHKAAITWFFITLSVSLTMLAMEIYGYSYPNILGDSGKIFQQCFLVFGWILISTFTMIVYNHMKNEAELAQAAQSKKIDDLVKVLFHDLANPLGRISIGLNITKRNDPELTKQGIDIASKAAEAMIEITQNVRKMYAISTGKARMDVSPFLLVDSIEHCLQVCATELEKKKIRFSFDRDELQNLYLTADAVSFKNQVLCNIISNAIKFSPPKKTITLTATEHKKGFILIEIKDQGVGMPPHILENLFEITKMTTRQGTIGETGSGFGMHLMKSFLELSGGRVEVISSEENKGGESGTTFKLSLKGYWQK